MSTVVDIDEKIEQVITTPDRYKVILLNDDHTPMDFVIQIRPFEGNCRGNCEKGNNMFKGVLVFVIR